MNFPTTRLPAKTFLIGEYAALQGLPAILLTTRPYFTLSLKQKPGLQGIHPDSPAGRFWLSQGLAAGLCFEDPYHGLGGMGASSAQFLGAYQLYSHVTQQPFTREGLLTSYEIAAWDRTGQRPSGYDVIAQSLSGCVQVDRNHSIFRAFPWPFKSLSFMLVHTQVKCETHTHLKTLPDTLPDLTELGQLSEKALKAFQTTHEPTLIEALQDYHAALQRYGWVTDTSLQLCQTLLTYPGVRAAKGCGAMGSDVLVLLVDRDKIDSVGQLILQAGLLILAVDEGVFSQNPVVNVP